MLAKTVFAKSPTSAILEVNNKNGERPFQSPLPLMDLLVLYECLVPHLLMKQVSNRCLSALHSSTNLWHCNKIVQCSFLRLRIIALHLERLFVFYLDELFAVEEENKSCC